jgi:hypothetical protein
MDIVTRNQSIDMGIDCHIGASANRQKLANRSGAGSRGRCSSISWLVAACFVGVSMGAAAGCQRTNGDPVDPAVLAHRAKLLLMSEPPGAVSVLTLRDALAKNQPSETSSGGAGSTQENKVAAAEDIVVVGVVGGMPNPWEQNEPNFPWRSGEATFFLVDSATVAKFGDHEHSAGESHSDCPFCARRAAQSVDSIAVVSFVNGSGEPLPFDAQALLDIAQNDTVVVRGTARIVGGSLLVIDATGVYVRRDEPV